jgi:hypothetical protein
MKKYKIFISIVFIFIYLLLLYWEYAPLNKYKKASLYDLQMKTIDMDKILIIPIDAFHSSSFHEWGIGKSWLLQKREKNLKLLKKEKNKIELNPQKLDKNYNLINRVICLHKTCWEFMGIVKIQNKIRVTLLSKEREHKLETFKVGDNLLEGLKIRDIIGDEMLLFDEKKNEVFSLKLFDVDISKYYPKELQHKKENNE